MADALFRLDIPDAGIRWASGDSLTGPERLISSDFSLDDLLSLPGSEAMSGFHRVGAEPLPDRYRLVAPIETQEIWAAGVTYFRSRAARLEESAGETAYDRVYTALRPELFFKSPGWRARGSDETIGIRADSDWNVPEPELGLVLAADQSIVGYTIGNDVSSRAIEGANLLYLPQAKIYDDACALGPCLVPADAVTEPFELRLTIVRSGSVVFAGVTTTAKMARSFSELSRYLGMALTLPVGALLLTGTGTVPDPPFTLIDDDQVEVFSPELGSLRNTVATVGKRL